MTELDDLLARYGETVEPKSKLPIMVVDDDPGIGRSLSKVLKAYNVVLATSGREALSKITPAIYCVIMDAKMPGMDGFAASTKIWELYPNIPIIMHTAFHGEHRTSDVVSYHFFAYVEKGTDIDTLKLHLRNACEGYANKLEIEEYKSGLERKVEERTEQLSDAIERLKETQDLLVEQERLITERKIAGGMAHEIRNTLGAAKLRLDKASQTGIHKQSYERIMVIVNILRRAVELERQSLKDIVEAVKGIYDIQKGIERTFEEVRASIQRGLSITNRVMNYSRELDEIKGEVDLQAVLEELISLYKDSLRDVGIALNIQIEAAPVVYGASHHFHSVFQNLLLNARDAIKEAHVPEGVIDIRLSQLEDRVMIEFQDNGVGISQENLGRVFDPFFSTKPSTGIGLGLSESQKIMKHYGGNIEVESSGGNGSTLRVVLPNRLFGGRYSLER
jgi:signal transduction histidine kinase